MRVSLAVEPIGVPHRTEPVAGNAIMHADRGSQHHSRTYQNALRRLEIRQSTSLTGSSLARAAAESLFATVKCESGVVSWPDRVAARRDIEIGTTSSGRRLRLPTAQCAGPPDAE
jgi:transposase InsO family protein